MNAKFCILAAGEGSRVRNSARGFNKGLLPLAGKAAISHIIDKVPIDMEIVLVLNPETGPALLDYCRAAHTQTFTPVWVENFRGKGSGPAISLMEAKDLLQQPFYLCTVDCIFTGVLGELNTNAIDKDIRVNWLGYSQEKSSDYSSFICYLGDKTVKHFKNKDQNPHPLAFCGLAAILDYEYFWKEIKKTVKYSVSPPEFVYAFTNPSRWPSKIRARHIRWFDVGSEEKYDIARNAIGEQKIGLEKLNSEQTYFVRDKVIKITGNEEKHANRIKTFDRLSRYTPPLLARSDHALSYEKIPGKTLYEIDQFRTYQAFVYWMEDHFKWGNKHIGGRIYNYGDIHTAAKIFYAEKTFLRITQLPVAFLDFEGSINGIRVSKLYKYLEKIDWFNLHSSVLFSPMHGDLQFDNILKGNNGMTYLLDPREEFGNIKGQGLGDRYYDLAKLLAGSYFSFRDLKNGKCGVVQHDSNVALVASGMVLQQFREWYLNWLDDRDYNLAHIKTILPLIYLNMAPLHPEPIRSFLFYSALYFFELQQI